MANPLFYTEVKKIGDATIYQVIDVQNTDAQYAKPVDEVFYFGDDIAIELKKQLNTGNVVTIPVETVTTKGAGAVLLEDFTVVEPATLEAYKNKKKSKVNNIFTYSLMATGGLVYFKAMASFAVLASHGYFITEENREEKYLEIINTGDESLIAALEEYLDSYDNISPVAALHTSMKQAMLDIDAATTEEEVDAAAHMFDTAS